ncbi:MAG: hypothetical protein IJ333_10090 [Clostridia bacterium]|nr:hypothetical protein [Clostridia bacterium]
MIFNVEGSLPAYILSCKKRSEENRKNHGENNMKKVLRNNPYLIYLIFAGIILLVCGFVFISNYGIAYNSDTEGGFIPPSFLVIFYHFLIVVFSAIIAIVIKVTLKNKIRIWLLLLLAILLPILSYNVNYQSLKWGGKLYFLVDKGGPLYFIRIGDYNFDGINDEKQRINTQQRTVSSSSGAGLEDDVLKNVRATVTGVGRIEHAYISPTPTYKEVSFHFDKNRMTIHKAVIDFEFKTSDLAKKTTIYIQKEDGQALTTTQSKEAGRIRITLEQDIFEKFDDEIFFKLVIDS